MINPIQAGGQGDLHETKKPFKRGQNRVSRYDEPLLIVIYVWTIFIVLVVRKSKNFNL